MEQLRLFRCYSVDEIRGIGVEDARRAEVVLFPSMTRYTFDPGSTDPDDGDLVLAPANVPLNCCASESGRWKACKCSTGEESGSSTEKTVVEQAITNTVDDGDNDWKDVTGGLVSIPSDFAGGLVEIDFDGTADYQDFGDVNVIIAFLIDGVRTQGPATSDPFSLFHTESTSMHRSRVLDPGAHTIQLQIKTELNYPGTSGRARLSDGTLTVEY